MQLDDALTLIGLAALIRCALEQYQGNHKAGFRWLGVCMALWFMADVRAASLFCLVDFGVMAYAAHHAFPLKPTGQQATEPIE